MAERLEGQQFHHPDDFNPLASRKGLRLGEANNLRPRIHLGAAADQLAEVSFSLRNQIVSLNQRLTGMTPPQTDPSPICSPRRIEGAELSISDLLLAAQANLREAMEVLDMLNKECSRG